MDVQSTHPSLRKFFRTQMSTAKSDDEIIKYMIELDIAVYDTAFLSLAEKLDAPLITLDMRLSQKLESTKFNGLIECPANKTARALAYTKRTSP